jgi:drug/metabolite transporter (DMT)-like permease
VIVGLASALVAAAFYGVAAILQATGARNAAHPDERLDAGLVGRLLREPSYLASLVLTLLGFTFHLFAVRELPLFLAQVGIAVSLVVTALLAVRVFGDHLSHREWAAIAGVVAGLMLLASSAGDTGTDRGGVVLRGCLVAALVVMAVGGFFAAHSESTLATGVLGLLGGTGYAVVGVSSRLLPDFELDDLLTSVETYTLCLGGVLAYLLYSLALQRGAVTAATTPLIAVQTVGPSIVGVVFLGDEVISGRWPVLVIGFLVTVVSAFVLVRFEVVDPDLETEPS